MFKQNGLLLLLALIITGCDFHCRAGGDQVIKGNIVSDADNRGLTGAMIKNEIDLKVSGTKIAKAYLMDESHQYMDNVADEGQQVTAVVESDTGWVKVNGKSFIGASERVIDGNGMVILDSEDLFKDFDETGFDTEIARLINLTAVVKQKSEGTNSYTVFFKIWDKRGAGKVSGKYKLRVD